MRALQRKPLDHQVSMVYTESSTACRGAEGGPAPPRELSIHLTPSWTNPSNKPRWREGSMRHPNTYHHTEAATVTFPSEPHEATARPARPRCTLGQPCTHHACTQTTGPRKGRELHPEDLEELVALQLRGGRLLRIPGGLLPSCGPQSAGLCGWGSLSGTHPPGGTACLGSAGAGSSAVGVGPPGARLLCQVVQEEGY
ncbi:hypothetical protein P7K49_002123 [Saguinus oedipus]|uniref:Uncharacterized protein n=1 Tax=Saguinus oedipus TaxID=9490 RepID=A0ABQ9WGG7_SAGOE|nr:hypothetical protein P7K49_002123 [Saguinus oedipus]